VGTGPKRPRSTCSRSVGNCTVTESIGFMPHEERTDIWGPDNPCLIFVKPLNPDQGKNP
jgi:hypothetical protein